MGVGFSIFTLFSWLFIGVWEMRGCWCLAEIYPPRPLGTPPRRGFSCQPFLKGLLDLPLGGFRERCLLEDTNASVQSPLLGGVARSDGVGRSPPLIKQNPHGFKSIRSTISNQCKPIISFFITHCRDRLGNFNDPIGLRNWLQYLK